MTNFFSLPLELRQRILLEAVQSTNVASKKAVTTLIRRTFAFENITTRLAKYTEQCQDLWCEAHDFKREEFFTTVNANTGSQMMRGS